MSAAAVLAVIVAAGEAHTPLTEAMVGAAKEAVGSAASVHVTETHSQSDSAVLRVEASLDALAAVALVWDDDQHLRARTRLHVARSDRWTTRDIVFEPGDRPFERGRALGFTIASMLPEAGADIEITLPESFTRREAPTRNALQFTVLGAGGAGPLGVGGGVAGEMMVTEALALRAGATLRQATIQSTTDDFAGTVLFGAVGAGACWWFLPPGNPDHPLAFGLRADVMGVFIQVRRDPESSTHPFAGADLMAQGTLRVASGVQVVAAGGVEAVYPKAALALRGDPPTPFGPQVAPLQAVVEVGLRFLF